MQPACQRACEYLGASPRSLLARDEALQLCSIERPVGCVLDDRIEDDVPALPELSGERARCRRMVAALGRRKVLVHEEAALPGRALEIGDALDARGRVDHR